MKIRAYAKINWALAVLGRRDDGYHELDTVMQNIDLYDEIEFNELSDASDDKLIIFGKEKIEVSQNNTVLRAVQMYKEKAGFSEFFSIKLEKNIPSEAGLGGGSADAAATLLFLQGKYSALDEKTLYTLAADIGADVPFCLAGGAARCNGIGEKLEKFDAQCYPLLIVKGDKGISTAQSFALYDKIQRSSERNFSTADRNTMLIEALMSGDKNRIPELLFNDLESVSIQLNPQIGEVLAQLKKSGALISKMSGSGSACFGLFESASDAEKALKKFSAFSFSKLVHTF